MARRTLLCALALAVALVLAPQAAASWRSDAEAVEKGLRIAVRDGKLTRAEARGYRRQLARTRVALHRLSWTAADNLGAILHDAAVQSRLLNRPRALVLFSELRLNRRWLREHAMPASREDVFDRDGVLYRSFPGQGLRFHPLGNFARLNGLVARGRDDAARRLAGALAARGIKNAPRKTVWEYTFPFWGPIPWTSGMAQASAAQTLAWAGDELGDRRLKALAGRAYRAIPGRLTMRLASGPWVRLYSFNSLIVLNAQLQSALSIGDYARRAGDARAARFAARLRASSARLLPSFDTGYWSYYSPRNESPLTYHLYVIQLLRKLWERTGNPLWRNTAATFDRYTVEPPILRGGPTRSILYPRPPDGFRDQTRVAFWLSKESTVTLRLPGLVRTMHVGQGWHKVTWRPANVAPGTYHPRLTAFDLAGNKTLVRFDPVIVRVDRDPPVLTAALAGRRLTWSVTDRGTPWVRVAVRLDRPNRRRWLRLGIRPLEGSARLPRVGSRWDATLVVADSSRNRAREPLGPFGG